MLKGCVKAAGWGTRDNEGEGVGRNEMSIKSQSKGNKGVGSSLLFCFGRIQISEKRSTRTK